MGDIGMIEVFNATLTPMLVLFICMLTGFILKKKGLLPDNASTVLSKLENYVLVPALILNTFIKYCTIDSISQNYNLILYCLILLVPALVIALVLSKVFTKDEYQRNIYKYALTFGNFSFMGNAIVPIIMGEEALYLYMLFILPLNVAVYTWGLIILIPKGEKKQSIWKSLLNPIFISILIGAAIGLSGISGYIPTFAMSSISNLSACMGPLAMVLTGFVIGGYNIKKLLRNVKIYIATALRLIILPSLFIILLHFIGAGKTTLLLAFFAFGTPLGLNTVVFPAAYGGDTSTGASMAMISHTLCVISIPLIYSLIQYIL